ncbi:MAG: hypothetical protein K6L76_08350 [Agarilytica sp.]
MRLLAEFIMRGRMQAVWMALLGSWIPLLSQTTLSLVSLRKGWHEGLFITFVACIPAIAGYAFGEVGITMVIATISVYLITHATALLHRAVASWPSTLIANLLICILFASLFGFNETQVKQDLLAFAEKMRADPGASGAVSESQALLKSEIDALTHWNIMGIAAFLFQMASLPALLLSRWMQSMLYNPGGFKTEFHNIRLNKWVSMTCLAGYVVALNLGPDGEFWALLFATPLVVTGFGLVHSLIAKARLGTPAIVAFYIGFVVLRPISIALVMLLSATDVFIDYRKRIQINRDSDS